MPKKAPITQATRDAILRRLAALEHEPGLTQAQIAKEFGVSTATVSKIKHGFTVANYHTKQAWKRGEKELPPPPLPEHMLSAEARHALEDFAAFRLRYFDRRTPAFQIEVANRITALQSHETLIALWPPGFGKTTCVSHDLPIWRMIKARVAGERFACLLLSKSGDMARAFLRRIKKTLEENRALQRDYGWFKPELPDTWTRYQISVDGFDSEQQGKEATFMAAGAGTHIYGWRVDQIICDDLVDKDSSRNVERQNELRQWFHEEVESRLERGGSLAVCGTRFAMHDLYGQLLGLRDEETGEPMYEVVRYAAHDAGRCPGKDGPHNEYPRGCHIWPEWRTYKHLMRERQKMGSARFDFVYNQVESSTDENLFRMEWIEAAKDTSRVMWSIPRGARLLATMDPSPTAMACAQLWAYDEQEDQRYLVAIERGRMTVPDMCDLMTSWTLRCRERGLALPWVFEQNAAQRWLLQSTDYKLMHQRLGVRVIPHDTHRNKTDPEYGVQSLAPLYEYKQISLPWGDPDSRERLRFFIDELKSYPVGQTDDGVMAQWFFEFNLREVRSKGAVRGFIDRAIPGYLKSRRRMVPLGTGAASGSPY